MPIPHFDVHGNLAVGQLFGRGAVHYSLSQAALHELHARFVTSARRAAIWAGWMRHRQRLDQLPVPYLTLVDGSFTTHKHEPGDVDVCIVYDARVANALPPAAQGELRGLLDRNMAKTQHFMDLFVLPVYPFESPRFLSTLGQFSYWTRVFGIDRLGRQKGILVVNGGGVI